MRLIALFLALFFSAHAKLTVAVSYPYIASLTETIGGENVRVETLAQGNWDPHFVVPKPSLITKVRNADLLITNGADLEIGWLPPLLNRAANSSLAQRGNTLELAKTVPLIDIPRDTSRAGGDVHAEGNPHFHLDPHNIPLLADAVAGFLGRKDPANAPLYQKNLAAFKQQWNTRLKQWDAQMAPFRGKEVVQYHPVFNYFLRAYGIRSVATIEPLAGIPPSTSHTMKLIRLIQERRPCCIMHDVYHPTKTGEFLREKTGIRLVVLPHDVGAQKGSDDLASLFDTLIQALK
ncbi:MAG: zinc ABC transporter substrate-binding protein [Campylobacterales bacterium]|nr:zinc ABC transporter substrate-binding protein [Campylobacterales bacterium]